MIKLKKLKRKAKKLAKNLDTDRGLTLKKTFDASTSFYSRGKENAPFVVLTAKGDFRISVVKLALILAAVSMLIAAVVLGIRSFAERLRRKRARRIAEELEAAEYAADES